MNKKILVIGDTFLDKYLHLEYRKQNPEADGSVYNVTKEEHFLGGAAAVAMMCSSLGADVELASVVGTDQASNELVSLLEKFKIDGLIRHSRYQTSIKTRMIVEDTLYPDRFDTEKLQNILDRAAYRILCQADKADIILISDYGKGVCMKHLLDDLPNKLILVDPAIGHSWEDYYRASIIKCNEKEAIHALQETGTVSHITDYARTLADIYERTVVVTRGEIGIQYAYHNQSVTTKQHSSGFLASIPSEKKDICGAGDTVFAVIGVYLARGASLEEAIKMSIQYASQQIQSFGIQPLKELIYATKT